MNRFRLIDEVSVYLHDRNNIHITLLYAIKSYSLEYKVAKSGVLLMYL